MGRWDCFSAANETLPDTPERFTTVLTQHFAEPVQQQLRFAILFIPLLCQWAAISRRPAVHLTRRGTLNKPWERQLGELLAGALLDMLSVR